MSRVAVQAVGPKVFALPVTYLAGALGRGEKERNHDLAVTETSRSDRTTTTTTSTSAASRRSSEGIECPPPALAPAADDAEALSEDVNTPEADAGIPPALQGRVSALGAHLVRCKCIL